MALLKSNAEYLTMFLYDIFNNRCSQCKNRGRESHNWRAGMQWRPKEFNVPCGQKKIPSTFEERNVMEAKGLVKRSALLNTRDWCSSNWSYVVSGPISMYCTMKR